MDILFLALLTALSLVLHGYGYGIGAQTHFIPMLRLYGDPNALPPGDLLHIPTSFRYSLFWPSVWPLTRVCDIEWTFFLLYLVGAFLTLAAAYAMALHATSSKLAAYVAVLLFLIPKPAGHNPWMYPPFFVATIFTAPLALFALSALLRHKLGLALALAGAVLVLHPISGAPLMFVILFWAAFQGRAVNVRETSIGAGVGLLLVAALLLFAFLNRPGHGDAAQTDILFSAPADWLRVLKTRTEYAFLSLWPAKDWASLFPLVLAFLVAVSGHAGPSRRHLTLFVAALGLLWLLSFLFTDLWPVGLAVQLQLARSTGLFALLTCIALAVCAASLLSGPLGERLIAAGLLAAGFDYCENMMLAFTISAALRLLWGRQRSPHAAAIGLAIVACGILVNGLWPGVVSSGPVTFALLHLGGSELALLALALAAALAWPWLHALRPVAARAVLCLVLALVALTSLGVRDLAGAFRDWVHLPHRAPRTDWRDVQLWAKAHTPPSALFIVPVDAEGFRIFSERGQVTDWKDGSGALLNPAFALEWERRIADFTALEKTDGPTFETRLRELAASYGATFAVVPKRRNLTQPPAYENATYAIYALN
ncbi:MAG: hypothetical protein FJ279_24665 [Planctomycetes bacterium]|nr:hypothetical protein [Planctomycetota bacterium]